MRTILGIGVLVAALIAGCKEQPTKFTPGQTVTVRGELVSGAECPMIVQGDGRRFSVGGDLGRFKVGDRVCITGTVADMSICMAGEATIAVGAIGPENSCP